MLDKISNAKSITRTQFIPLFEKLDGSKTLDNLWHSGSIYRKKTKVFGQPLAFQELVRFVRNNKDKKPAFVFDGAIQLVRAINGSRVNTVSEIMMIYNCVAFTNLNKNSIKVLTEEDGVQLKSHRNAFRGVDYENYCSLVKEISTHLGLRNMMEADSFSTVSIGRHSG